jgi:hypothetical protein
MRREDGRYPNGAPNGNDKFPLTEHGHLDATVDPAVLHRWWTRRSGGIPAITTGEPSGVVALDIDIRPAGSGFDSLENLGIAFHPESPTAHTPRGGCAVLFRWPGHVVKTVAGMIAPHLDIRADGGSLLLPPGPGRFWDPHLGPDTPLAPMPKWMVIVEPELPAALAPYRVGDSDFLDMRRLHSTALSRRSSARPMASSEIPSTAKSTVSPDLSPAAYYRPAWRSTRYSGPRDRFGPTTRGDRGERPSWTKWCELPLRMALPARGNRRVCANDRRDAGRPRPIPGDQATAHRILVRE